MIKQRPSSRSGFVSDVYIDRQHARTLQNMSQSLRDIRGRSINSREPKLTPWESEMGLQNRRGNNSSDESSFINEMAEIAIRQRRQNSVFRELAASGRNYCELLSATHNSTSWRHYIDSQSNPLHKITSTIYGTAADVNGADRKYNSKAATTDLTSLQLNAPVRIINTKSNPRSASARPSQIYQPETVDSPFSAVNVREAISGSEIAKFLGTNRFCDSDSFTLRHNGNEISNGTCDVNIDNCAYQRVATNEVNNDTKTKTSNNNINMATSDEIISNSRSLEIGGKNKFDRVKITHKSANNDNSSNIINEANFIQPKKKSNSKLITQIEKKNDIIVIAEEAKPDKLESLESLDFEIKNQRVRTPIKVKGRSRSGKNIKDVIEEDESVNTFSNQNNEDFIVCEDEACSDINYGPPKGKIIDPVHQSASGNVASSKHVNQTIDLEEVLPLYKTEKKSVVEKNIACNNCTKKDNNNCKSCVVRQSNKIDERFKTVAINRPSSAFVTTNNNDNSSNSCIIGINSNKRAVAQNRRTGKKFDIAQKVRDIVASAESNEILLKSSGHLVNEVEKVLNKDVSQNTKNTCINKLIQNFMEQCEFSQESAKIAALLLNLCF